MKSRLCAFAALFAVWLTAFSLPAQEQNQREISPEEYKVYEAVFALMVDIPKKDPHVTIFSLTLNGKCGEEAEQIPLANGCSFLWIKPDTKEDVRRILFAEWADMENSTWSDFEGKSAASARLHEPISTPWKHRLVGPRDAPVQDWKSPDLAIFLSRVGFDLRKTEAMVYVLTFSYLNQVATAGDYFHFRLDKAGQWKPVGRLTYFTKKK